MSKKRYSWIPTVVLSILALATPSLAADGKFDLGFRTDLGLGSGKPSNDIIGFSLFGHYRLNDLWGVGFAIDHSPEFDFERTPEALGLATSQADDAKGTSTTLSGWLERLYRRPEGQFEWFWNAGIGFNSVDMKDLSGTLVSGDAYDITTDAGGEFQMMFGVGARRWFGSGWGLELALHHDLHSADWKLTDRVSGATGTISDYSVNTINLGFLKKL